MLTHLTETSGMVTTCQAPEDAAVNKADKVFDFVESGSRGKQIVNKFPKKSRLRL